MWQAVEHALPSWDLREGVRFLGTEESRAQSCRHSSSPVLTAGPAPRALLCEEGLAEGGCLRLWQLKSLVLAWATAVTLCCPRHLVFSLSVHILGDIQNIHLAF